MKKIITTNAHAPMDYGAALILLAGPWILQFAHIPEAKMTFVFAGALVLVMSLFTRYEGGLVRVLPMKFHLAMDVLLGIFLAASPWIFGFFAETWLWHVLMGVSSVFAGLCTRTNVPEFLSLKGM